MIVKIEGELTQKDPTFIVLKTAGVSYGIQVSLHTSTKLVKGEITELLITQILKEDSNKLFGFLDEKEQFVFNSLLKINGIGASTAMAVCSSMEPASFFTSLAKADVKAFTSVPGIGLKGAKRIITELGDEKNNFELKDDDKVKAKAALLSLGFKEEKINKVLLECSGDTTLLIKQALKKLS